MKAAHAASQKMAKLWQQMFGSAKCGQHQKAGWEISSTKGARKNKGLKPNHVSVFVPT